VACERVGADARVTSDPDEVARADLAVLPGVGSARSAMQGLAARGLDAALRERVAVGRPTLGICLGLQLALEWSDENGGVRGLALLTGRAVRLRQGRVPRIGWARVEPGGEEFYFAHSFVAVTPAATATSEGVVAVAESDGFVGVQFHPEKSGRAGARFLERCLSLV
jgi:imidazole glycerol-phosphate synthase subunit HisH